MVEKNPQSNPGAIEALKAATRQVGQSAAIDENPGSPTVTYTARGDRPTLARPPVGSEPKQKPQSMPASETFAEAFVRKITSVEQEKAEIEKEQLAVDQELNRAEQLRLRLIEKKKQLENRRNELITVKDKLIALDEELSKVLDIPSLWPPEN